MCAGPPQYCFIFSRNTIFFLRQDKLPIHSAAQPHFFEAIIRQTVTENRADFVNKINNAKALAEEERKKSMKNRSIEPKIENPLRLNSLATLPSRPVHCFFSVAIIVPKTPKKC